MLVTKAPAETRAMIFHRGELVTARSTRTDINFEPAASTQACTAGAIRVNPTHITTLMVSGRGIAVTVSGPHRFSRLQISYIHAVSLYDVIHKNLGEISRLNMRRSW